MVLSVVAVSAAFAGPAAAQAAGQIQVTDGPNPSSVAPGESFDVTFEVSNTGDQDASTGGIQFDTPPGVSADNVFYTGGIAAGSSQTSTVTFNVDSDVAEGDYTLTADSTVGSDTASTNVDFNVATDDQPPEEDPEVPPYDEDASDVTYDSYGALTDTVAWQGQEIDVDVGQANTDVALYVVNSFGQDGDTSLRQQLETDENGIVTVDTADEDAGDYFLTGATGLPSQSAAKNDVDETFSINEQTLTAAFDTDTVTDEGQNSNDDGFEFDSNRGTYPITVHANGDLDTDELADIFTEGPSSFTLRYTQDGDDGETDYDEIGIAPVSDADDYNVDFTDIDTGSYEFTFTGTDSTAEDTDSIEVTAADEQVTFDDTTQTDSAGDIVELDATFEDTDEAFIQIGGEDSDFVDVLYVEADDTAEPVEIDVNTRLLGTNVDVDRVYSTDNIATFESEMHGGIDTYDSNFVYGEDGRNGVGNFTEYLAAMNIIDDSSESKYDQLVRPLQSTDYEVSAAGVNNLDDTEAVFDADTGGTPNDELGSQALTLTQPEIGEITTHTAPEEAADDETNVSALVSAATPREEIAVEDQLIVQVEATGLYGTLVDGAEVADSDFDRLDDGVSTQIMSNLTELSSEQLTFEVVAESATGNQDPLEVDLTADNDNSYIVLDEENGQFFLVVDTSSDDSFANGDAPDSDVSFTATMEYDADNDDDRFEFASEDSPQPYENADGAANYPYLLQGETLSNSQALSLAPRSIVFDNLNSNQVVEVAASENAEISGTTNVAPGTDATLQIDSSDASSSFRQGNDINITEDGSITTAYDLSDQEVGDEFDISFNVLGSTEDTADGILVESTGSTDDGETDDGEETNETDTDDGEDMDDGEPADDGETNETTDDGESTDDGTPGFGAVVALIALIGAALLAVRRQN